MSGYYKDEHRYDDIMQLPHHQSTKRAHMSLHDRAAQFAPFAALTGHEAAIEETARLTEDEITLDETAIATINEILYEICSKSKGIDSVEKISAKIHETMKERSKYMEIFTSGIIKLDELKTIIGKLDKSVLALREKREMVLNRAELICKRRDRIKECVSSFLNFENVTNIEMRKIVEYIGVNSDGLVRIHLK